MNQQILKLYTFKLAENVKRDDFLRASLDFEGFLREQEGFEYRSLSYSQEDDVWVDAIYLANASAAAAINHAFMEDSRNQRFMQLIDRESIAARHTAIEQSVCMSEAAVA